MTGFGVDHQQLSETAAKTGSKAAEADGIQQKVDAANGLIPEKAWGLLGDLTVYHFYTEMHSTFQDHISNMIKGVQKLSDDIKATADQYRENDEAAEDKLKDIEKELGDAGKADT